MEPSYWNRILSARIGRRRALITTIGSTAGAALIAACGGSSSSSSSSQSSTQAGLLTKSVDTSSQAKRGGTYVTNLTADPQHLDPQMTLSGSARAYSLLLNQRAG